MKARLAAGAELDFLTPEELRAELENRAAALRSVAVRESQSGALDANGLLALPVYRVPAGMDFELGRLLVELAGATPGTPVTLAAGWYDLTRGGQRVDFQKLDAGSGGLPARQTWGGAACPHFRNGEELGVSIFLSAASANLSVVVSIKGRLFPSSPPARART